MGDGGRLYLRVVVFDHFNICPTTVFEEIEMIKTVKTN